MTKKNSKNNLKCSNGVVGGSVHVAVLRVFFIYGGIKLTE